MKRWGDADLKAFADALGLGEARVAELRQEIIAMYDSKCKGSMANCSMGVIVGVKPDQK